MRLIDSNKLIQEMRKWYWDKENDVSPMDLFTHLAITTVQEQPTAFDVDKVVEQLKKLKMRYFLTIANTGDADKDCAYKNIVNTIDRAIDIVKGGGAE